MNDTRATPPTKEPGLALLALPAITLALALGFGYLVYAQLALIGVITATSLLCFPFVWVVISAFRPAMPARACPSCEADTLVLIDPQEEYGVRCLACDHRDLEMRIPYLKDVMNDPDIAREAGFVIDQYGQAHLAARLNKQEPSKPESSSFSQA
jgi:hypothetical protein